MVRVRYEDEAQALAAMERPLRARTMSLPVIPGYEHLSLIGSGAFSRVYKAEQTKLKRNVAIKVLNFGLNDEADRVSFQRETELMARVSAHRDIVTVHDTEFTSNGQPCIVMELYSGGSLANFIAEMTRLTPGEVLEVGVGIASALDASHLAGIVHCDLKPQNILVSELGEPALGDFGISTFAEERTRSESASEGGAGFTLPYAAPEIIEGEPPTTSTDVYSLAATLYTALAGRRPFSLPEEQTQKPTAAEQARRILFEPVPSLANEGVPVAIDDVIRAAMAKRPEHRPESAAAFAQQLHEVGQRLGLGTSTPRVVGSGALRVTESASSLAVEQVQEITGPFARLEPAAPSEVTGPLRAPKHRTGDAFVAPAGGFDPRSDVTVHRAELHRELAPVASSAVIEEPGLSRKRKLIAVGLVIASLLAIASMIFVVTRGEDTEVVEEAPLPVRTPVALGALAPGTPTNVTLERLGVTGVRVTWEPSDAEAETDVVYEVRRQDLENVAAVRTSSTQIVLGSVAVNEAPCVTVMAVRRNRPSEPTKAACLGPNTGATIEVRPATCPAANCEVRVVLNDFAANSRVAVLVLDPDGLDLNGFGLVYEATADTDGRGKIDDWRLDLPPLLGPGDYTLVVADDVGEKFSAELIVTERQ